MYQHFRYQIISNDAIRPRLFLRTLYNKALECLDFQPTASINTWNDLVQKFYTKFFLPFKIAKLKHGTAIFHQGDSESFKKFQNRFKNILRKCPDYGINKGLQDQYFYVVLLHLLKAWQIFLTMVHYQQRPLTKHWNYLRQWLLLQLCGLQNELFKRKRQVYMRWMHTQPCLRKQIPYSIMWKAYHSQLMHHKSRNQVVRSVRQIVTQQIFQFQYKEWNK